MVWLTICFNIVVYGEKWVWWIWSLVYFHSFESLNNAFEVHYFRASFLHLPKYIDTRAAERISIWGGKDKKGHCNVKKGTKHVHADNYH